MTADARLDEPFKDRAVEAGSLSAITKAIKQHEAQKQIKTAIKHFLAFYTNHDAQFIR
jgi:hypothetical protein